MELKKHIYDETNGLTYTLVGDYYIPDLMVPDENVAIGKWGRMYRTYLEENRSATFNDLLLSGKLYGHFADIDAQANARFNVLVAQMKAAEGITEELKEADQMTWVGTMNNIRNRAEEIVMAEIIYG